MLLQLILAGLFLFLLLNFNKKSHPKALPGPRWSVPLFGHLFHIGSYPHKTFLAWKKYYGPIYKVNMGTLPFVIINDGPLMRKAFNSAICSARPNMRIYQDYSFNGRGFTGAQPQVSRERRQFFVKNVLKESNFKGDALQSRILTEVGHLVAKLETTVDQPVQIVGLFTQHIVNTLMNVMTSMRFEDGDPRVVQFQRGVEQVTRFGGFGDILVFYMPLLGENFPNLSGYRNKIQVFHKIIDFFRPILAAHLELYEKDAPRDLLDAYLDSLANPKNSDASDELNVLVTLSDLFVAGMETTSKSLEWLIYYLIKHPEIQTKMQFEIKNVLQGEQVALQHRPELDYTEAVIEETLRMSTVVRLGLIHAATEDYEISGDVIPKGTFIMGNLYGVNHDPNVWEDPDVFCPERFLDGQGKFSRREEMLAFSTGKRGCIGEIIARYQLFLYAATIFQKFTVQGIQDYGLPSEDGAGLVVGPDPFKAKFDLINWHY